MQITFDMPHVFHPVSTTEGNAYALRALLDCLVALNKVFLREHPTSLPLYKSGVRYGRTQIWDTIPALYRRGFGDCKSLTAALIAENEIKGLKCKPVFRWVSRQDGSEARDFHILVMHEDGSFEDPSKILGMGLHEVSPILKGY